jgi:hypothetical protein
MKTAQQILESKGYDNSQIEDVLYHNQALDMKVRAEFGVEYQPLHLWEAYYLGDADEEEIERIALKRGHDSAKGMLLSMDIRLNELAEEMPSLFLSVDQKIEILVTLQSGHPNDINPLLSKYSQLQSRFSDYVDEFCIEEEKGQFAKDLTEEQLKELAIHFINDNWQD